MHKCDVNFGTEEVLWMKTLHGPPSVLTTTKSKEDFSSFSRFAQKALIVGDIRPATKSVRRKPLLQTRYGKVAYQRYLRHIYLIIRKRVALPLATLIANL